MHQACRMKSFNPIYNGTHGTPVKYVTQVISQLFVYMYNGMYIIRFWIHNI